MAIRNTAELRHRVSLEKPADPQYDGDGYPLTTDGQWEPVKTVWALARDVSGKEFFEAHATQALNVVTFEMRALKTVPLDNNWSIVFRGVRYYVQHINHRDYKGLWWEVKASVTKAENLPMTAIDGESGD